MKKVIVIVALTICQLPPALGQTFNVVFDENNSIEAATVLIQTPDSNFLVAGTMDVLASYEDTIALRKIANSGEELWLKKYFLSPVYGHWVNRIFPLANGNYVLSGSITTDSTVYSDNPYLLEIDGAGNQVAFQHYGTEFEEVGVCAARAADGGFYMAGWSDRYESAANHNADAYVIKTDSNYTMQWIQYYQRPRVNTACGVYATPDTGCVILTENRVCCSEVDASLIKLDKQGNVMWEKSYMNPDMPNIIWGGLTGTQDGGYIMANALSNNQPNDYKAYIAKTDGQGNLEWYKLFKLGYNTLIPQKIIQLDDGSYMVIGSANRIPDSGPYVIHAFLLKLSPNGDLLWQREFKHYPNIVQNYFYGITPCLEGGFAMCGMVINDPPERNNMWVVKTDTLGNDCYSQPYIYLHYYHDSPLNIALLPTAGQNNVFGLSPQAFGGCPPYTYAWTGEGAAHLDQTDVQYPQFSPPDTGFYTFYLHVNDGDTLAITDTLQVQVVNDTSVLTQVSVAAAPRTAAALLVYPNPAQTTVRVSYQAAHAPHYVWASLADLQGRIWARRKLKHPDPDGKFSAAFDTDPLPAGIYVVQCTDSEGHSQSGKLQVLPK